MVVQEVPVECVPAGGADTTDGAGERVVCFVAGRVHEEHGHASERERTSALEELKRKRKLKRKCHVCEKMCETERWKILAFYTCSFHSNQVFKLTSSLVVR